MSIRKSTRTRKLTGKQLELQTSSNSRSRNCQGQNVLTNIVGNESNKRSLNAEDEGSLRPAKLPKTQQTQTQSQQSKQEEDNDRIDPVEKLLSLNYINQDMNEEEEEEEEDYDSDSENDLDSDTDCSEVDFNNDINKYNEISLNFTKILNDNLQKCYSNFNRSPIDFYNDNSSFALLNKQQQYYPHQQPYHTSQVPALSPTVSHPSINSFQPPPQPQPNNNNAVPFFKSVNFNPKPKTKTHIFDEIISLDDEIDPKDSNSGLYRGNETTMDFQTINPETIDPKSEIFNDATTSNSNNNPTESDEELTTPNNSPLLSNSKMCFNYRQYDNLNLSNLRPQPSNLRILNENSILSGKASETIGSGIFLMNDFFL